MLFQKIAFQVVLEIFLNLDSKDLFASKMVRKLEVFEFYGGSAGLWIQVYSDF